jgi:hypothetical protein
VEGTGDQENGRARRQQLGDGGSLLRRVDHRRRAGHGSVGNAQLLGFAEVALTLRGLTRAKGTGPTGEQQPRRLAGAVEIEAGQEAIGILPLAHPGRPWGGVAAATEHHDRIGARRRRHSSTLPGSLEPTPEALAHHPKGEDPKQQQGGDHGPAPTADQADQQQNQAETER